LIYVFVGFGGAIVHFFCEKGGDYAKFWQKLVEMYKK